MWFGLVFLLPLSTATPVFRKLDDIIKEAKRVTEHPDYCILPPDMGPGTLEFLEDCTSLHQHPDRLPQPSWKKYGTHPLVCCPRLRKSASLCFPSDPGCPSHKPPPQLEPQAPMSPIEEHYSTALEQPLMSDQRCSNTSQTCLPVAQCGDLAAGLLETSLCGYDEASSQAMVCCGTLAAPTPAPKPRFPEGGGGRRCEDRHSLCSTWASLGACRLDTHHRLTTNSPAPTLQVSSRNMFLFMATTCPKTCGLCGAAGCRDDHPRCEEWAKSRQCTSSPEFMATVCRESCGVCGFLSPFNREEQEDKGLSYTDIDSPTFDCGRDPPFCVRDGFSCETGKPSPCLNLTREETLTTTTTEPNLQDNSLDLRSDLFFAFTDFGNSYCSLIPITDKWALGAAHCYIDYATTKLDPKGMTLNYGTEFEEDIEFKKVYRHPNYQAETLYNDVAVLEFGRRTLANVAKTNTTPDCIDPGIDLTKQDAFGEGFGQTACRQDGQKITLHQFGDVSKLFKVSLIENDQCERELNSLGKLEADKKRELNKALPRGLSEDIVCSVGEKLDHGVFSGACKGDSGGAMKMRDPSGRQTLVGLVSGGLSCGQGEPGWNTRLAVHRAWIACIINSSRQNGGVYSRTLKTCDHLAAGGQDGGEDVDDLIF